MFKLNKIFSTLLRAKACLRSGLTPLESPLSLSSIWSSSFSRMSKPPRQIKTKIKKRGVAISDEKGAKLAKEEEAEEKKKKIEAEKKRIEKSKIKKIHIRT